MEQPAGTGLANFATVNFGSVPPGQSVILTFTVKNTGDTVFEMDETLTLSLSAPVNGLLETAAFTGTILNDDAPPALKVTDGSVTESSTGGPFRVWISATLSHRHGPELCDPGGAVP